MDQLFGDATTAMPTPQQEAEIESLMSGNRSPVPSIDLRRPGDFTADSAIPGLDINPPDGGEDGKPAGAGGQGEGVGGWISRMINRSGNSRPETSTYRQVGQHED